jgi:hypothetical protein
MTKLLGSAGSLEALECLLGKYFFSESIIFKSIDAKSWQVFNGEKLIDGIKVVRRGDRYRAEIELSDD